MFAHEGTLIELLAPSMQEHLPRVIATDRDRGWMLAEALPVPWMRDVQWRREEMGPQYDDAMRVLARLQQAWVGREDELLTAGCTDRRLATMPAAFDELLASDMVRSGLSDEERSRIAAFGQRVPALVEELLSCGVPETLMHGDFHPGNIARDGERTIIYDWTDGCVSHPFFDMATFLPQDAVERAALLQVYLGEWGASANMERVERAWELAEPLACIHHSLSYMRILAAVEPPLRSEFDTDVTFWLRWLRELLA
jgi:aminoglycoside/choline kinase family phosphotransferase